MYLAGIDVGSVTTKLVVIDEQNKVIFQTYLRTAGGPILAIQSAFRQLGENAGSDLEISGVGTTGSGRHLASIMV
ncbi:MAG TPA: 2-hydroxyglutaryl-CoA dehydratase, partial [Desulfotomaculum sp.]|nr:2-hydroxyglutaryl-CoA dehydratase [Desulfotomaculum sp.]